MKIALLGDMAFFGKYTKKNESIFEYFKEASELLKNFDFVIGNLETPFCENCSTHGSKSAYIKSDFENVELLKYLNVSIVNLSNNHIYDYGKKGVLHTKNVLNKVGIDYFGIDEKQITLESKENKIALNGYCCYSTNGLGLQRKKGTKGVNVLAFDKVRKRLEDNDKKGYLNILSVHAGQEHVNYPNYDHITMARKLSEVSKYIYYGHHPHVIQGVEIKNDSLLAYSLGNFCFDDVYIDKSEKPLIEQKEINKKGIIISLEIDNNILMSYESIPIYMGESELKIGDNKEILKELSIYSEGLELGKEEYISMRQEKLNEYLNTRKTKRNFNWYIRRMRFKYASILIKGYLNKKKYNKALKNYL